MDDIKKKKEEDHEDEKITELEQKVEELENKYKRALADYQNLQKREAEERRGWIVAANKDLLLRILPVLDTLILAGKHEKSQTLQIAISHFLDILKSEGVTKIETQEKMFDPHTMEAIDTQKGEEGKVLEENRAGYKIYDTIIRPAQVVVGKKGE